MAFTPEWMPVTDWGNVETVAHRGEDLLGGGVAGR